MCFQSGLQEALFRILWHVGHSNVLACRITVNNTSCVRRTAGAVVSIGNAIPGTFRYDGFGLDLPYIDLDNSNELHVSLSPRNGAKVAGAAGEVRLIIVFQGS